VLREQLLDEHQAALQASLDSVRGQP